MKLLSLKLDVNEKQKRILNKFAEQICKFSQAKVSTIRVVNFEGLIFVVWEAKMIL